jgi:lysophospholipase L1-like esterase
VGNALNPFVSFYSFDKNYPVILQQLLAGRYTAQSPSVYNAGSPAERAAGPLTLSRFTSLTSSRQFEAVLIMEGSNDIADRDSRAIPPAANALQLMVRDAKSRGMRVLLATIPPEDPTRCNPACRGLAWSVVDPMNAAIRGVAAAEGVALVDVNQALAANVPLYISADGLHPTEIGNAKIAEVFFEVLKTAFDQPPATLTSLFRRR